MTTTKRKAVDQVNCDFSDFSLSSPATKIRRLDYGELAPIMEEDDEHEEEEESHMSCSEEEETNNIISNEERAIVLFNPRPNLSLDSSPHTLSLTPHMFSSLKGQQRLWSKQSNLLHHSSSGDKEEDDVVVSNQCLAVVPWVHSHLSPPETVMMMMEQAQQLNEQDDDNDDFATMDIEPPLEQHQHYAATGIQHTQTSQLQHHHCMVPSQPLPPHNASSAATAPTPTPTPTPTPVWFH